MPDDDDGWGGIVDEGWAGPIQPSPSPPAGPPGPPAGPEGGPMVGRSAPFPGAPIPSEFRGSSFQPNPPAPTGLPPRPRPGRTRIYGAIAVSLVVAAAVVVVVLVTSGGNGSPRGRGNSSQSASHSPSVVVSTSSVPDTHTPTTAANTSGGGTSLLDGVPFSNGCTEASKSSYYSSSVTDQVVCVGSDVQSNAAAQGVSYAKFPDQASLDSWYRDTILQKNNIQQNSGDCTTGQTVTTQSSAVYCEGAFTTASGTRGRQAVVQAPSGVVLTNGPNSTSSDCPNLAYSVLVFTSPSNLVGAVAITCSATPAAGNGLESALTSGAFDLQ